MSITIAEDGSTERITCKDEQIERLRSTVLSRYEREGNDVSKVGRSNPIFAKARNVVETLDSEGFDWGRALDSEQKYWAVVWMTRALKGLRQSYKNTRPMFVEVF